MKKKNQYEMRTADPTDVLKYKKLQPKTENKIGQFFLIKEYLLIKNKRSPIKHILDRYKKKNENLRIKSSFLSNSHSLFYSFKFSILFITVTLFFCCHVT